MIHKATDPSVPLEELREMGAGMNHAIGAILVLIIITLLSVYKPKGVTQYGWRKLQEKRRVSN